MSQDLEEAYRRIAADESREAEALDWIGLDWIEVLLNDRIGILSEEDMAGVEEAIKVQWGMK
jgi:hypothetical protein